jgi:SAM-dependent methyltransferase
MSEAFGEYSRYYDLIYADKDYRAEADYVAARLRNAHAGVHNIVEFGCGTGRHAALLAEAGFAVTGIERSPTMLAQCRRVRGPGERGSFTTVEGDVRNTRAPGSFEAVISLFHVVSYQTTNDDVVAMFRNAARHLQTGGLFLFDVWYGPAVLTLRPEVRVKRVGNEQARVTRIAEPDLLADANRVDVRYEVFIEDIAGGTIRRLTEAHRMRYFSTPEIGWLADLAGFRVINAEEWLTGQAPSTKTWGVAYLLRKETV